jgi:hypothetical protein
MLAAENDLQHKMIRCNVIYTTVKLNVSIEYCQLPNIQIRKNDRNRQYYENTKRFVL